MLQDIFGHHFIVMLLLIPTLLGGGFIVKYMIHYWQWDKHEFLTFLLYSGNFTMMILLLKFLFIEVDDTSPYGNIISDISLLFITIIIDYFIASYYKNMEYTIFPLYVIFIIFYIKDYGIELRPLLMVGLALILFWFVLYGIIHYKTTIYKKPLLYILVSIGITVATTLIALSQFPINRSYAFVIFCKVLIILGITRLILVILNLIVQEYSNLRTYSYKDDLTQVYNRRKFEEVLQEVTRSSDIKTFSLVSFDIDNFKQINDSYGHGGGDYILSEVSHLIKTTLEEQRSGGQLFRYGGDEFFILFRQKRGQEAFDYMNTITQKVGASPFVYEDEKIHVTLSSGVGEAQEGETAQSILRAVDKNLYIAKLKGKNQVYFDG